MEDERLKHVCKFCKKRFACGRSLGGHIRCHLPKPGYKLRENPRKTWRVESLSSAVAVSLLSSSSSPSDETDQTQKIRTKGKRSSINNSHSSFSEVVEEEEEEERHEEEDNDEESDVAFCLIMLSRDAGPWGKKVVNNKRKRKVKKVQGDDDMAAVNVAEPEAELRLESSGKNNNSSDDKSYGGNNNNTKRGKNFECTTCNKVFHSYQALGGHKASHRRGVSSVWNSSVSEQNSSLEKGRVFTDISLGTCPKVSNKIVQQKHECPFCFRVFGTGQALGGHKRSHLLGSGGSSSSETRDPIIELDLDLNLPPKQARDESTGNGNGNGNGIAAASSISSLVGLIKPYWWVEDHNKNEPFLSLVPN